MEIEIIDTSMCNFNEAMRLWEDLIQSVVSVAGVRDYLVPDTALDPRNPVDQGGAPLIFAMSIPAYPLD